MKAQRCLYTRVCSSGLFFFFFFFAIDEIPTPTPDPSTESILPRGNSYRDLLLRIHEVKINGQLTREAEFQVGVFRCKGMCCNGTCNLL